MIETHAHLYAEAFDKDRQDMMERALEAGVSTFYMPNIDTDSIDPMMEVESKYPQSFATIGLHPCSVDKQFEESLYVMEDWLNKRSFKAIGEIGLDFYWDTTHKQQQIEALKIQIEWAKINKLPIILHCRDSFEETFEIVKSLNDDRLSGVFHCFSGTAQQAKDVGELGFKVGIGGVVTFKNGGLAEHIPDIDLEYMVLETDCPYLTPTPYRGKRNEPLYLDIIAQKIADLKQVSKSDIIASTTINTKSLFNHE